MVEVVELRLERLLLEVAVSEEGGADEDLEQHHARLDGGLRPDIAVTDRREDRDREVGRAQVDGRRRGISPARAELIRRDPRRCAHVAWLQPSADEHPRAAKQVHRVEQRKRALQQPHRAAAQLALRRQVGGHVAHVVAQVEDHRHLGRTQQRRAQQLRALVGAQRGQQENVVRQQSEDAQPEPRAPALARAQQPRNLVGGELPHDAREVEPQQAVGRELDA
eukprot:102545-Prymnesium_polylepis.1